MPGWATVDLDFVLDLLAVAVTKYCGEQTCQAMYELAHSFRSFILGLSIVEERARQSCSPCGVRRRRRPVSPHTGEPPLPPWPYPSLPIAPGARGQVFTL